MGLAGAAQHLEISRCRYALTPCEYVGLLGCSGVRLDFEEKGIADGYQMELVIGHTLNLNFFLF